MFRLRARLFRVKPLSSRPFSLFSFQHHNTSRPTQPQANLHFFCTISSPQVQEILRAPSANFEAHHFPAPIAEVNVRRDYSSRLNLHHSHLHLHERVLSIDLPSTCQAVLFPRSADPNGSLPSALHTYPRHTSPSQNGHEARQISRRDPLIKQGLRPWRQRRPY